MDIPYASPPQGMKYFTIIGPHIDCMEEQYLVRSEDQLVSSLSQPPEEVFRHFDEITTFGSFSLVNR